MENFIFSMNRSFFIAMMVTILSLSVVSCGRKNADTSGQIKQALKEMAAAKSSATATNEKAPAQQLDDALAAYKSGDYQNAVIQLQAMRFHAHMTGAQLLALNSATDAVMNDLYARMAKGDEQAQAAIKEYQRLQNSPQK